MTRAFDALAHLSREQRERLARIQTDPRTVALLSAGAKPASSTQHRGPVEHTARVDGDVITVTLKGLALPVTVNARERMHRQQVARLRRGEHDAVRAALVGLVAPAGPWDVTIVRIGPGQTADDDGVQPAGKAVRDEVATWLGCDDGDVARFRCVVTQERGRGYAVRVIVRGRAW